MKNAKSFFTGVIASILGLGLVVAPAYAAEDSVYEIASDNLTTLPAALDAAELADLFNDDEAGPYTVFAPVDSAFAALDPDTLSDLLLPENIDALTGILTYHVVEGTLLSTDLSDGMEVPTLNGATVEIDITGDVVSVNNATVVTPNIMATNGVVHLIDTVLLPPTEEEDEETLPSIAEIAAGDPDNFSSLVAALDSQGLVETLAGEGSFTVFAPTNDAFANLPGYVQRALERDPDLLTDILLYHVTEGKITSDQIGRNERVTMLSGDMLVVRSMHDKVTAGDATVIDADIHASNGVIHVIDEVLIPRSFIKNEFQIALEQLREIIRAMSGR